MSPVTTDFELIKTYIDQIQTGILEPGTAIGNGLASAINRLKDSESKSKVIILLTDGVNNAGYVDPLTAIEMAKKFNIKIYSVGIGTNGYVEAPVDFFGKLVYDKVMVEIDEDLLKNIAGSTGGNYYRATDNDKLKEIYNEIDKLEKTKLEVSVFRRQSEEFRLFAIFSVFILILVFILENTYLKTLP
jgi:Ca-activated chloride channel family protein